MTTGCPPNTRPAHLAELEACKIYLCSDAMPEYLNVEGDRCLPVPVYFFYRC